MKKQELLKNRAFWELVTLCVVILMALSVLTVGGRSKTSLTYDNGKITYTGYVRNNKMNGQGKLVYDNGDVYEGGFVNGVFSGKGTFTSHSGWTYEGEFKNGQAHGQGKLIAKDNTVYEGTFEQGIYQK